MKKWVKGGLIGGTIAFVLSLLLIGFGSYAVDDIRPVFVIFMSLSEGLVFMIGSGWSESTRFLFFRIFLGFIYFIFGAIVGSLSNLFVGWIMRKKSGVQVVETKK